MDTIKTIEKQQKNNRLSYVYKKNRLNTDGTTKMHLNLYFCNSTAIEISLKITNTFNK